MKKESGMILVPCKGGNCPECATEHEPWEPHNLCLYYQYHFYGQHQRFPTWADAMAHCTDKVKASTIEVLKEHGVSVVQP
jgi:hypothetical protein